MGSDGAAVGVAEAEDDDCKKKMRRLTKTTTRGERPGLDFIFIMVNARARQPRKSGR
jgi:hypothetical protein